MSAAVSKFLLATMTIFIVGVMIKDPDLANRPVQLREISLGYAVFEQGEE